MFLTNDDIKKRENKIRGFISNEPAIAVILAAVHFEWTMRRAIIVLGISPNTTIHKRLRQCHGLDKLKGAWKDEVGRRTQVRIDKVVTVWPQLWKAFDLRNRLVHGGKSTGSDYAATRVKCLLQAARDIQQFCKERGSDLYKRLPIRRKPYSKAGNCP